MRVQIHPAIWRKYLFRIHLTMGRQNILGVLSPFRIFVKMSFRRVTDVKNSFYACPPYGAGTDHGGRNRKSTSKQKSVRTLPSLQKVGERGWRIRFQANCSKLPAMRFLNSFLSIIDDKLHHTLERSHTLFAVDSKKPIRGQLVRRTQ